MTPQHREHRHHHNHQHPRQQRTERSSCSPLIVASTATTTATRSVLLIVLLLLLFLSQQNGVDCQVVVSSSSLLMEGEGKGTIASNASNSTEAPKDDDDDDDENEADQDQDQQKKSTYRTIVGIFPFTTNTGSGSSTSKNIPVTYYRDISITQRRIIGNVGKSHMIAALIAMKHFNERNPMIVSELYYGIENENDDTQDDTTQEDKDYTNTSSRIMSSCTQYFNMEQSIIADSQGSRTATLSAILMNVLGREDVVDVDAIIDGYYFQDGPSLQLGTISSSLQLPYVSSGGYDINLMNTPIVETTKTTIMPGGDRIIQQPSVPPASSTRTTTTSRVFADIYSLADAVIQYLHHIGRNDYVGLLHSIEPTATQIHEAIHSLSRTTNMNTYSMDYVPQSSSSGGGGGGATYFGLERTMTLALSKLLPRGYRTIIVVITDFLIEIPLLAKTVVELNMNRNDYVWILVGNVDVEYLLFWIEMESNPAIAQFLIGIAVIQPVEQFTLQQDQDQQQQDQQQDQKTSHGDPFLQAWFQEQEQSDFIDLIRQKTPSHLPIHQEGLDETGSTANNNVTAASTTSTIGPGLGSGFVYDAIMTVGLGFCAQEYKEKQEQLQQQKEEAQQLHETQAQQALTSTSMSDLSTTTSNTTTSSPSNGIHRSNFVGATGHVLFDANSPFPGQRLGYSVSFAVYNIKEPAINDLTIIQVTDVFEGITDSSQLPPSTDPMTANILLNRKWKSVKSFVYSDGTILPPILLRTIPEQNYLARWSRAWGFTLFGISMILNIIAGIWITWYKNHRVVKAGQPEFLQMVTLGSTLFVTSIIPNSFDESSNNIGYWDEITLGYACNISPWLIVTGFMLIYSGLWLKLWRVNRVLQFVRTKITIQSVMGPAIIVFVLIFIILLTWAILEGFEWRRIEIDDLTGESVGGCAGDRTSMYFTPIVLLMMIPIILTGKMAWHTRDVDSMYSESRWIVIMIISQFQLLLISIPVLLLVDGMNPNIRYVGQSSIFAVFSLTTMTLIVGPKLYEVHFVTGTLSPHPPVGGGSGGGSTHSNNRTNTRTRTRGSRNGVVRITGLDTTEPPTPPLQAKPKIGVAIGGGITTSRSEESLGRSPSYSSTTRYSVTSHGGGGDLPSVLELDLSEEPVIDCDHKRSSYCHSEEDGIRLIQSPTAAVGATTTAIRLCKVSEADHSRTANNSRYKPSLEAGGGGPSSKALMVADDDDVVEDEDKDRVTTIDLDLSSQYHHHGNSTHGITVEEDVVEQVQSSFTDDDDDDLSRMS